MERMLFEECLLPPEFVAARGDARRRPVGSPRDATPRRSTGTNPTVPDLSARAVSILMAPRARKRMAPGATRCDEAVPGHSDPARLLRAAGRVSRQELLDRPRVGHRVVAEIDAWLAAHGKRFRPDPAPLPDALARALGHIQAMLEGDDEDAFLSALVALPELRRSLDTCAGRRRRRR